MTRAAIEEQFDVFFDEMIAFAKEEMSPTRTMSGVSIPVGDDIIKDVMGDQIGESMEEVQRDMERQRDVVLDYAEDLASGAEPGTVRSQYEDRFLQTNPVYKHHRPGPRRERLQEELLDHLDGVAADLAPIVDAEEEDFWDALTATVPSYEEASSLINEHFSQAETFRAYQRGINMEEEVRVGGSLLGKTVEVDYTDEAIRVIEEGEAYLRSEIDDQLRDAYDV